MSSHSDNPSGSPRRSSTARWTGYGLAGVLVLVLVAAAGAAGVWYGANELVPEPNDQQALAQSQPHSRASGPGMHESFAPMVQEVGPAVVNIAAQRAPEHQTAQRPGPMGPGTPFEEFFRRFFGPEGPVPSPEGQPMTSLGSGFIIDPDGYIVTNGHVVGDANQILITLRDGRQFPAERVGVDPQTDLALLKVEAEKPLPHVQWGDSSQVKAGDWVLAVGSPFGLGGTVTAGIVSALGRDLRTGPFDDFLQIDAPINQGNSGGPAFNMDGKVIGVNAAIFSPNGGSVGIGFAIPSNLAHEVVADLKDDGQVDRGWLGVRVQTVTPEIAESLGLEEPRGALVAGVGEGTPAARAGLKVGDVILSFGGKPVAETRDLPRMVASTAPGEEVEIEIRRNDQVETLSVELGDLSDRQTAAAEQPDSPEGPEGQPVVELQDYGIALTDVTEPVRQELELGPDAQGVAVVAVDPSGVAAKAGLRPGDLVRAVGGEDIVSVKQFVEGVRQAAKSERAAVLVHVERRGSTRFVGLPLPQA